MATLTIRQLDDAVYQRLKESARANNRSLEAEARHLLGERTRNMQSFVSRMFEVNAYMKTKYGVLPDSTEMIRQMRDEE